MSKHKYIINQTEKSADILLHGIIGFEVDGREFALELDFLDGLGLDNINIRINSGGGDVFQGFAIISAMLKAKTHITTIIEGIAASMGSVIAVNGNTVKIMDFAILMIHNPAFSSGSQPEDNSEAKMLEIVKDSLVTILVNRTGLNKEDVSDLMTEETFMSAETALGLKIVDEIISSEKKDAKVEAMITKYTGKEAHKYVSNHLSIVNEYDKFLNQNKTEMKKIAELLGLDENATEAQIMDAIANLNKSVPSEADVTKSKEDATKLTDAEAKVTDLEAKLKTSDGEKADLNKNAVESFVDNCITNGRLEKENRDKMVESGLKDFENLKLIVESLPKVNGNPISNQLGNGGNGENNKDGKVKTYDDYDKEGGDVLYNIKMNDPAKYEALFKAEFGKEPV